ncbi:HEAT repeat domain-containing protein [Fulvivirga aurantia]|uniref:HEAT repeat domain-containing protein n=1 Tax=Fulvivirga aurantia TaxID=2529383 RepID=UPI0016251D0C|nr:HEAT repeat domain-containing protein [Fulvivirga aurantia]
MTDIQPLINQLKGDLNDDAYQVSDQLAEIGSEEVVKAMVDLMETAENEESRIMAARTLSLIEENQAALTPLFEAMENPANEDIKGDLVNALEGFDLSQHYVPIFKLFLYGNFRVSRLAKDLLDHEEFEITPRVLKKARKNWNHYANNTKQDDAFALRKQEVENMLADLDAFVENNMG